MKSNNIVSFSYSPGLISLIGAPIIVEETDFQGIHIAANNLAQDFTRVTKGFPNPIHILTADKPSLDIEIGTAIIVGSVTASPIIKNLEEEGKLDLTAINGGWESFVSAVVENPFPGCCNALVIAGSDKRGTIFGVHTLSEQIGVSPWYWWADVVPQSHQEIYAVPQTTHQGEPSIRFRGIFINDEAPALTGWVREKFGGYNVEFYKKVFELLLRLKANFLWPAMWPGYPNPGASFFTDDPENQKTADDYGICVSTSHHEPMQRLSNEWFAHNPEGSWDWLTNKDAISKFFMEGVERAKGMESYFTLGMRGEYDKEMPTDDPAAVVRDVIRTQRQIFMDIHGREDAVPQLLALYKEVQEQYESGRLEVPDDVTLLFADDNFGTLRRLPTENEKKRKGGAGIYYHFEYVGDPRSYKWINSNSLGKTWHQLQEAYRRNARQIWVFNVGDIKPLEVPMTFAFNLAWDINSIKSNGLPQFFTNLAEDTFGLHLSPLIGAAWHEYDRLVLLRRHEHIEPTTFSLLHYNEAETILNRWKALLATAKEIQSQASSAQHPSIFELVLYPIKASYLFTTLQIQLRRNQLHALQRRNTTNPLAAKVLDLFSADFDLTQKYHTLLNGKWNQIAQQPHYGFGDTWHAPSRDMISGLCYIQARQDSNLIVGQMGVTVEGHLGIRPGRINEESDRMAPSRRDLVPGVTLGAMSRYGAWTRWFDIFTRGTKVVRWRASVPHEWIHLSVYEGVLVPGEVDQRVKISIDWEQVPVEFDEEVLIDIRSLDGAFEQVHLPINGRKIPETFTSGFVEGDGYLSIPASSCVVEGGNYQVLPSAGRTSAGAVVLNPTLNDNTHTHTPFLNYEMFVFSTNPNKSTEVHLYFSLTLDVDPSTPMQYSIKIDDDEPSQTHRLIPESTKPGELPEGWFQAVQDCVWVKKHELVGFGSGTHVLRVALHHSNLMLETLVVDLGGVKDCYLGPPSSIRVGNQLKSDS